MLRKEPSIESFVADSRSPRDGRFIAEVGTYDPNQEPRRYIKFDEEATQGVVRNRRTADRPCSKATWKTAHSVI